MASAEGTRAAGSALEGSRAPLYVRTADDLARQLDADLVEHGDRLPSERTLAQRYGVSRVTMRAALGELARRGVLNSSPARGWFVASASRTAAPPRHSVLGFADYAREHGLTTATTVIERRVRPATIAEAETFRVAPGSELFDLHRLRYLNKLVVLVEHNRIPLSMCPALATTDFDHASLYAVLRAADPPQYPRVARYFVEARPPSGEEQKLLDVSENVPMLVATQISYNQAGRPLEHTIQTYRSDRYRFSASITD